MARVTESRFMDNPDPRDQPVKPYQAPSEAMRIARAVAAVDLALEAKRLHETQQRRSRAIIEQLVVQHGKMWVMTCVQAVADWMEYEAAQR